MISKEEVLNIANLSKLYLDESEIENAIKEMDGMINFANEINNLNAELDTAEYKEDEYKISNAFHEDEIEKSYPQSEILQNVNGGKDGYFYIKKAN